MRARRRREQPPARDTRVERYVLAASFVSGAVVLVVEMLGTRLVSPYYGASVYVWSALIAVTLGSLTVGYVVGGWAADRSPPLLAFALATIAAGLHLLLVPGLRTPVLAATTGLGLEAGALASAIVLVGPPLVLLGMTGPPAIRLVTTDVTVLGRGIGAVYGASTLGSMLGAVLAGFVLIPGFAVATLLRASAVVLLALGGAGLALGRRPLGAAAALAVAVLAAATAARVPLPSPNVRHLGHSFYGELKVVDIGEHRVLLIDGVDNGFVDRQSMEPRAPYVASFGYLPAARPHARRALCIGLGAGGVPRMFARRFGIATDVVEIDPAIAELARRWLGFPADIPVIVEDGRTYVERTAERYDFVVLDAFHGETHPVHLFTREFFARVDAVLAPGGILAINMAGVPDGDGSAAWRSVHRTLAERFREIRVFATPTPPDAPTRITNLFLVASRQRLPDPSGEPAVAALAAHEIAAPPGDDTLVLTDDYNPIDDLQRAVLVAWREAVIRNAHAVLLAQ